MEGAGGLTFDGATAVRKRRSFSSRRPRSDSQFFHDGHEFPSFSPTFGSDPKAASDDNSGDDPGYKQKELKSINGLESEGTPWTSSSEDSKSRQNSETIEDFDDIPMKASEKYYGSSGARNSSEFKRSSEGVLAPANWKSSSNQRQNQLHSTDTGFKRVKVASRESEKGVSGGRNVDSRSHSGSVGTSNGMRSENDVAADSGKGYSSQEKMLRKVKLKVGGVTHTIHTKATHGSSGNRRSSPFGSSTKPPRSSDASRQRHKLIIQDDLNDEGQSPPDSGNGSQGIPWTDFKEPVRKSKRVPKRRVLDGDFDGDDDDEIRYLERLKTSKTNADYGSEYDEAYQEEHKKRSSRGSRKRAVDEFDEDVYGGKTSSRKENSKKARTRDADDLYCVDEEESSFANEDDESMVFNSGSRRKKPKTGLPHGQTDDKEIPLTTRQRALQSGKDASSGVSLIEFPDGLPPAAPRKQKEKLSEVEQQLKKAEAAQRRRMQVEKAARESEAQAIRKILGQDANGKKKEDKLRKRKEELAQEKAARAMSLASNTVRWVMGPSGTVVSFPEDAVPSIFNSQPSSYPPPREKCAGPSCTNAYKYRDSKSKLPLCSLQCYKAVNKTMEPVTSC
ncbi:hypothetical protein EJ110_NYTH47754 [Nymphaea thermarum]|nr:hypothetical protein EJ110_NYTH47754 [Nymphaea thermarum]